MTVLDPASSDSTTRHPALRFDDQVAIVTGGGGSLGSAYSRSLASRGAHVIVQDLPGTGGGPSSAQAVVDEITAQGGSAIAVNGDAVADAADAVVAALDTWGRLDVVIANAGAATGGFIDQIPVDEFERIADVGYRGTTRLLHHAWDHLRTTRGRAVLTSSGSVFGARYVAPYTSSKASMIGLVRTLGMDGAADGIRVNAIMPAAASAMTAGMPDEAWNEYYAKHYTAERVASFVTWLSHDDVTCSGEVFVVGAGFAAKVVLGVGWGWGEPDASPEDFAAHATEVCSLDRGVVFPGDAGDEVNFRSDRVLGFHLDTDTLH